MTKAIIKEIIISLLLCLAIILIVGIVFYEYIPVAKVVPEPVAYTTPEETKNQLLTTSTVDEDQVVMTYEINSSDLNNYKKTQEYKPGKANPFSTYAETETNDKDENGGTSGNTSTDNKTTSSSSSSANNENTTSSGGKFFQDKGTK